ncbi:MAG: hypothetical protein P1P90_04025 [Patescibacteria group bacterium]|nr:hypothetical protein [Patescibacteria group bacterium]
MILDALELGATLIQPIDFGLESAMICSCTTCRQKVALLDFKLCYASLELGDYIGNALNDFLINPDSLWVESFQLIENLRDELVLRRVDEFFTTHLRLQIVQFLIDAVELFLEVGTFCLLLVQLSTQRISNIRDFRCFSPSLYQLVLQPFALSLYLLTLTNEMLVSIVAGFTERRLGLGELSFDTVDFFFGRSKSLLFLFQSFLVGTLSALEFRGQPSALFCCVIERILQNFQLCRTRIRITRGRLGSG